MVNRDRHDRFVDIDPERETTVDVQGHASAAGSKASRRGIVKESCKISGW